MSWPAILLQFLGILLLPLASVVAMVHFVLGRVRRTRACCPRCRAEHAFATLVEAAPCPGCGAPASEAQPVPAIERPAWRALPIAILCALLAVGAVALGNRVGRTAAGPIVVALAAELDNATLIAQAAFANHPMDGHVVELGRRVRAGTCTPAEIRDAARVPLGPVPGSDALRRVAALAVIDPSLDATARGAILAERFAAAWPRSLDLVALAERPARIDIAIDPGRDTDALLTRVVLVDRILVDGAPIELPPDATPGVLGWRRGGPDRTPTLESLPDGARELVVEGEALYLDRGAVQVLELVGIELPRERWPRPSARHPIRFEARLPPAGPDG